MSKKQAKQQKTPPLAIASLILGIAAILFGWIPILGWLLVLTGLGISIAALVTHPEEAPHKGFAITGLVLSILSILLGVLFFTAIVLGTAGFMHAFADIGGFDNDHAMDGAEARKMQEATKVIKESVEGNIGTACNTTEQCAVPAEYAAMSNCPYEAICLDGQCALTCPQEEACTTDEDCACTTYSYEGDGNCTCIDGNCAAVIA
ncbi:MAG: hypothetical protein ACLFO2_03370 [Candidatus Woesearchaeota archaeon]